MSIDSNRFGGRFAANSLKFSKRAKKISVEDARAQWTTYDNLNQWFDDVRTDLVATGLVEDKAVLGAILSFVGRQRLQRDGCGIAGGSCPSLAW